MSELADENGAGDELGGEPEQPPKRRGQRRRDVGPKRAPKRRPPQEARIREALEAVGGWLRDRGDEELGGTLERDAPKMARVLGELADVHPLAKRIVSVLADVLEPVRAFGPSLRILWRRLLERRQAQLAELETEGGLAAEEYLSEPVTVKPPEPELAQPWRLGE